MGVLDIVHTRRSSFPGNELRGADVPPRHNEFTIAWTSSYVILRDGVELFRLNAQRQHSMRAPRSGTPLPFGTIKKRKQEEELSRPPANDE